MCTPFHAVCCPAPTHFAYFQCCYDASIDMLCLCIMWLSCPSLLLQITVCVELSRQKCFRQPCHATLWPVLGDFSVLLVPPAFSNDNNPGEQHKKNHWHAKTLTSNSWMWSFPMTVMGRCEPSQSGLKGRIPCLALCRAHSN